MGAVPLWWAVDTQLEPAQHHLFISLAVVAMLLAAAGIWTMFSIKWRDRTHPSILMGVTAIAVGMTAIPLRCAGHPEQGPPHPAFFIAITLVALVFASSCVSTALGRMVPDRLAARHPPIRLLPQNPVLQAFPPNLSPEVLDDIANTYKGVWEAIQAAHSAGTCTRRHIWAQVDRLRELAVRVDALPTAAAIRADADLFNRRARRAARSSDSTPAQYIRAQCHLRFVAAATIANYRRGG